MFRFIYIDSFPVFGDETLYLYLADLFISDSSRFLESLNYAVLPVFIWFLAIVQLFTYDLIHPVSLGRGMMVLLDIISAYLIYSITKDIFNKRVGIISMIVYLSFPLNFLHSRLILLEPLTNFLLILGLYFLSKVSKNSKKEWVYLLVSFFSLVLAFFTKPLAVVSFAGILSYFFIFTKDISIKKFKRNIIFFVVLSVSLLITLLIFYLPVADIFNRHIHQEKAIGLIISNMKINLWRINWWLESYIGYGYLTLVLLGMFLGILKRNIFIGWLFFWIISLIILEAYYAAHFYPRHLYLLAAPLAIVGAFIINFLIEYKRLGYLVIIFLVVQMWFFNTTLILDPLNAKLALEDRQQFFEDWTAGVGHWDMAKKIREISRSDDVVVFMEDSSDQYWAFKNLYFINDINIQPAKELINNEFLDRDRLNSYKGRDILVILNRNQGDVSNWPVDKIGSFSKGPNRDINLYRVRDTVD